MTIEEYLSKIVFFTGINREEVEIVIQEVEDRLEVNLTIPEERASYFIGSRGASLQALQYLVRLTFREEHPDKNIVLDINQYRTEKEAELVERALSRAEQVLHTGHPSTFRGLNSYERYLVHSAISEDPSLEGVSTESEDVDQERWLTIFLEEKSDE